MKVWDFPVRQPAMLRRRDEFGQKQTLKPYLQRILMSKAASVCAFMKWADAELPDDYLDLLRMRGGEFCNDLVRLYSSDELIERNETNEAKKYCPGFIAIGDDSGGQAIVIAVGKAPGAVYLVDQGSMHPDDFDVIAPDLNTWVAEGCMIAGSQEGPSSYRFSVRFKGKPTLQALKVLRELSPLAKAMSLVDLMNIFSGNRSFNFGLVAELRRAETLPGLVDAGFLVTQETDE
ncbi:SMI1/KNR4 family protein [Pseudoduganella lutea]|uniref:Knr4/Smi1-like domain-containing protein n=1 Tax=Pseudoduganella lutea TaxID=321985 RepID=A0A4P6L5D2_9BURK|nr:SMI1/KNR4 family protein [Pseudoduganella lutea]QBE66555.1 hypothetical protein EWM63_29280 [Pseudoduganella lutea]